MWLVLGKQIVPGEAKKLSHDMYSQYIPW
jgi:hypothetical protein